MLNKIKKLVFAVSILCLFLLNPLVVKSSVYVKKMDTPRIPLEDKWKQALSYRDDKIDGGSFWIVYTIEKMMSENTSFGMCESDYSTDLGFLLYGKHSNFYKRDRESEDGESQIIISRDDKNGKKRVKVLKKLAIMFRVDGGGKILDSKIATMDSGICFKGLPLIWIGEFQDLESLSFLKEIYNRTESTKGKEGVVAAIANHERIAEITPFLRNVINDESDKKLRESAIFWLGTVAGEENVNFLMKLALSDESSKARKEAVFAIYISKSANRVDDLIKIIRNSDDMNVRKEAVFWLGEYKSDEIAKTLSDIALDSPEIELQKSAVFALSQNHSSTSARKLINIAYNHKNLIVRKEAIFWLGQMDSEEAVDAIIKIAEED
jgi:hypothetical protein